MMEAATQVVPWRPGALEQWICNVFDGRPGPGGT
jgi:hypothetical protein